MVRKIKFRAWDKLNNKMIYPCSSRNDTYLVFEETGWFVVDHFTGKNETILTSDNGVLMQLTGFNDKEGKEIYEGDILKYHDGTDVAHYKIYWDEKQGKFFDTRLEDGDSQTNYDGFEFVTDCKVIGNLYETPELLRAVGV